MTIDCEVAPDATAVSCDAHLMETAIRNVLYNAQRYARRRIQVGFCVIDDVATLTVDDDGPGIAYADRERVFESFVRLDSTPGAKSGYGLGLAIVKRIVEWHDGSVIATDSALIGARFELRWPTRAG